MVFPFNNREKECKQFIPDWEGSWKKVPACSARPTVWIGLNSEVPRLRVEKGRVLMGEGVVKKRTFPLLHTPAPGAFFL